MSKTGKYHQHINCKYGSGSASMPIIRGPAHGGRITTNDIDYVLQVRGTGIARGMTAIYKFDRDCYRFKRYRKNGLDKAWHLNINR